MERGAHDPELAAQKFAGVNFEALRKWIDRKKEQSQVEIEAFDLGVDDREYKTVAYSIDRDDDTGLYTAFEQFDGSVVRVHREEMDGIVFVEDIIFSDYAESEAISLADFIPPGYKIIEALDPMLAFMIPKTKDENGIIVVPSNFFANTTGRIIAMHEIGHAIDFASNESAKKELKSISTGYVSREDHADVLIRGERRAWQQAKQVLTKLNQAGINWLPPSFDEKALKAAIKAQMSTYRKLREF